jgi:hypothetical protein
MTLTSTPRRGEGYETVLSVSRASKLSDLEEKELNLTDKGKSVMSDAT